jgi:hypothetical protein
MERHTDGSGNEVKNYRVIHSDPEITPAKIRASIERECRDDLLDAIDTLTTHLIHNAVTRAALADLADTCATLRREEAESPNGHDPDYGAYLAMQAKIVESLIELEGLIIREE